MVMRRPSTPDALYAWWRSALASPAPRHEGWPECGFFKMARGPRSARYFVPVEIRCEQETDPTGDLVEPERLVALVDGGAATDPGRVWTYLRPIEKAEFDRLADERGRLARDGFEAPPPLQEEPQRPTRRRTHA